jgi:hypothetical protein
MGKAGSRLVSSLLVLVALIWVWVGHSFPADFWGLLQAKEPGGPDWLGLAITGVGSAFCSSFAIVAAVVAFRLAFRPQPERLTLKPGKLVYEAGSSALMPAGGLSLWRGLLGRARYEVAMEDFGGASLGTFKGLQFVALQAGPRQLWIGRWLRPSEQEQLARTLTDWKQNPSFPSSWFRQR